MESQVNTKKIAKNTVYLYLRMMIVMAINLYTVRKSLYLLGEVDYGVYNVIGGFVMMFSFLHGTLTTASQRYFSIELAKGENSKLKQWFSLNITMFLLLVLALLVVCEIVGLWFVNCKMTIPPERMAAANWVFQFALFSLCFNLLTIPYNAMIIAHERMSMYAYIGIVEALLKLAVVFLLYFINWDSLIVYAILSFVSTVIIFCFYYVYNRIHFKDAVFSFYWNRNDVRDLFSFSGWNFLGTIAFVARGHGINVLLNLFFNPVVNAARGLSYQIYATVARLSNNFITAVKPQIYKCYAADEMNSLHKLVVRGTVISTMLVSVIVFPIMANTELILKFWLESVPDNTVLFTQLILLNAVLDATDGPSIASILATGKVKYYYIITSFITLLNIPVSYFLLSVGGHPALTIVVSISLSLIVIIVRAFFMRELVELKLKTYFLMIFRVLMASACIVVSVFFTFYQKATSLSGLIVHSFLVAAIVIAIYLVMVVDWGDAHQLLLAMKLKFRKLKNGNKA